MEDRIRQLLNQITALEGDLQTALHEHEASALYQLKGKRVEFERSVKEAHRRLKVGFFRWLVAVRPQNFLTAPVIYGMIIPLVLLDFCATLFQAICFPVYRIAKARRSDYIVFDRQHLEYLNAIEKLHCAYCAYANGLIAYICEIIARTEQYFCPIKHARKMLGAHSRYARFLAYGEAADFHKKLEEFRAALAQERERG
ncbi:MAG: hypothetical protein Q7U07_04500 [Gammaproteobacteria bacterium]|nr:hypothetical protein [Gammaproteobacteria bacterium]